METLLPSEVARLVYGYLIEQNCSEAADKFLHTSPHLKECLSASRKGKKFQTRFEGRNLVTILDVLSQVKTQAEIVAAELPHNSVLNKKLLHLLSLLSVNVLSLDDTDLSNDNERRSSSEYDYTVEEDSKSKEESDENVSYKITCNFSHSKEPSRVKSKNDCQQISQSSDNSSPRLISTQSPVEDAYRIDDRMDSDSQNESIMEAIPYDIDDVTEDSVDSENVDHFATRKRMKLVDNTLYAKDVECITPDVEVIDLDSEEIEEVEIPDNIDSNSTCISSSFDHVLADSLNAPENSYNNRFHNTVTSAATSSQPMNNNVPLVGPYRTSTVPNVHASVHMRPVNISSVYTGPNLVKALVGSHLANLQNSQPRFIAQPHLRPIHPAANFNTWVRKPNTVLPSAPIPPVPLLVNRQVIQTSSFAPGLNNAIVTEVSEASALMDYGSFLL